MSASLHVRTYDLLLENITYLIIIFSLWRTDMALLLLSLDQMSNIWSYVWTFELYIWKKKLWTNIINRFLGGALKEQWIALQFTAIMNGSLSMKDINNIL